MSENSSQTVKEISDNTEIENSTVEKNTSETRKDGSQRSSTDASRVS